MYVICRTNLDLLPCEQWPTHLPVLPNVGDHIESAYKWGNKIVVLKVIGITWKLGHDYHQNPILDNWYPEIELHLPSFWENISRFYEWYGQITGKGKSYFI